MALAAFRNAAGAAEVSVTHRNCAHRRLHGRSAQGYTSLLMKNRVRILRAEHGLTQAALAAALGVSRQIINAIEIGEHDPSLSLAFAISETFDQKIEDISEPGPDRHSGRSLINQSNET